MLLIVFSFYPVIDVLAEAKSYDYSNIANCADEHTKSLVSFGNERKHNDLQLFTISSAVVPLTTFILF